MLIKSDAIVLRSVRFNDSKLIVDLLLRECGRVAFCVTVSQGGRGKFRRNMFQPLTLLSVEADIRQRQRLQKLHNAALSCPYATLTSDPVKMSLAMFMAEFLNSMTRGDESDQRLFDYLHGAMLWLDSAATGYANFHLVMMAGLLRLAGLFPNLDGYAPGMLFDMASARFRTDVPMHGEWLNADEAAAVASLARMRFANMHIFKLTRAQRNRVTDVMLRYASLHLPDFPEMRSLAVVRELFE